MVASNAGSTVRHLCTRVSCVGVRDVARPVLKEGKIILVTPIVGHLPQWVLVLLQRMKHNPRSCEVVRRMLARGTRRDPDDGGQEAEPEWRLA
ncbi:hypothetical protein K443DRAFT_474375 [Laccaria amethystina LaAM-08-1]|uniref:Uncharacterized protein n=1 Tax=Laccaria amethystina LaAM-08-1 TaxID=1095629 RepID=A0A0C9WN77_9AGAR|nr:hypothetical protein K443DRAFT_474375 [Laccaria amethystina LaAM-08-1]